MSVDLGSLKARNRVRWSVAKITRGPEFAPVAKRLVAAKDRYQSVSRRTGVPWFVIAVIHEREASQNWNTQLGQGDPLNRVSTHVPKGRGPFPTWEDGAYDALALCAPFAAKWRDWTPGGTMTLLEEYNGLGYARAICRAPMSGRAPINTSKANTLRMACSIRPPLTGSWAAPG
jgi:lysozyme family protein